MAMTFLMHSWTNWLGTEILGTNYKLLNGQPLSELNSVPGVPRIKVGNGGSQAGSQKGQALQRKWERSGEEEGVRKEQGWTSSKGTQAQK